MFKRIVIKIGTKVISQENGSLDLVVLKKLVNQISDVRQKNIEVILVTSGAVGAGRSLVKIKKQNDTSQKQVLASVGQVRLMSMYAERFAEHGLVCAQVLVTKEDFRDKAHYFNMRNCFENLLIDNVIPVVNENDVIATTELLFTDNDELAGLVASQLNADAVIILTSVDGVLAQDKKTGVTNIVPEISIKSAESYQKNITPEKSSFGRGGMLTKFGVAKKLALQGITTYVANGKREDIVTAILSGARIGTKFTPNRKSSAIKRRIAYSEGLTKGSVIVNKCAEDLLVSKTKIISLLPVGVVSVKGSFKKGDIIDIINENGDNLGFGIAEYGADRAKESAGKKNQRAVIHYNHMFLNV